MAVLAATVFGNCYIFSATIVFGVAAILTGWIGGGRVFFLWVRWWSRSLLAVCGLRVSTTFETPLSGGTYLFMANHQSAFDIPVLLATLPVRTRFMAKRELFHVPVFGWALRVGGFIPVDREDRSSARESFAAAVERLESGASVLIFPEETRSLDGQLLPFRRGGFLLALKAGVEVIPVGIQGTFAAQPRGTYLIRPGRVTVAYGRPVDCSGFNVKQRRDLEAKVRAAVAGLAGITRAESDGKVDDPSNEAEQESA